MSTSKQFKIGSWTVEPALNRLSKEQQQITLFPKVMKVLMVLVESQGQPVSSQTLLEQVWPEQVVSDSSVYQAIAQLRKAFGDSAQAPKYIERVSGQGYRLIAEVRTPQVETNKGAAPWRSNAAISGVFCAFLLIAVFGYFFVIDGAVESEPGDDAIDSLTLVQFEYPDSLRNDPVSALSDVLMTQLNRLGNLDVVYLPSEAEILGTDVRLAGKIQTSRQDLQVFLNITEVETSKVLWSQIYEGPSDSLLQIQKSIVEDLLIFLKRPVNKQLIADDEAHQQSFEQYLLARHLWQQRTAGSLRKAEAIYRQMQEQGQFFALAAVGLCETYYFLHIYSDFPESQVLQNCQPLLQQALDEQPNMGEAMAAQAVLMNFQGKTQAAEALFREAIANSPNYATGLMWFGKLLRDTGRFEESLQFSMRAFQVEPQSPIINRSLAYSYLTLSQLDKAVYYFERALTLEPDYFLEPVQRLDFLPLTVERARDFLQWTTDYPHNLRKMPYVQMTLVQISLSLGEVAQAKDLMQQIPMNVINPAFALYMQAAVAIAEGNYPEAESLLLERMRMYPDKQRFVLPYLALLQYAGKAEQAHKLLLDFMPELSNEDLVVHSDNVSVLMFYFQLSEDLEITSDAVQAKLSNWFELNSGQSNYFTFKWQLQDKEQAKHRLIALMDSGWLPDLNADPLAEISMQQLFVQSGLGAARFQQLLQNNRRAVYMEQN